MQTIDVVIFSVVITFVSLSMAQNVLLNLSSDPAQVHAKHKIIMVLGLGAAGFSLFLFYLDENKGLPLILTVLAIVGIGAFLQKLKKDRQHATASQKFDPSEMSVADMLAAARDEVSGKSESTSTALQKLDPSEMSVADMLAAARDEVSGKSESTSTAPEKVDPSEMSVADMLAAARDEVSGKSESTSTALQKLDPSEMSVADMLATARDEVSGKSKATAPPVDEILAHCRKVDG